MVSEMIKQLPLEKLYIISKCFQERFMGQMEDCETGVLRKSEAEPKKRMRSHRAITLTSVLSRWYAFCIVLLSLRAGRNCTWETLMGISCQYMQVMMAHLPQKHCGWREDRTPMLRLGSGTPNNVHGKHGHQDSIRWGQTEASKFPDCGKRWPCNAALGKRGRKSGRKKNGLPFRLRRTKNTPTTSGSCPIPKVTGNRCWRIWFRTLKSGIWHRTRQACGGISASDSEDKLDLLLKRNSRSSALPWIVKGRRTSALKKGCNPETRLGGEMARFTGAKTYRGEWSAEGWWNMSTASLFFWGSENCPGARNPKTESKDRHQGDVSLISFQKTRKWDVGKPLHKISWVARKNG